jgi:hypothetical protein
MSETSEDKTKRKFVAHLRKPIWTIQYSVFYVNPAESYRLLEDQKRFRRELKRKFPDQPFLVRVQTHRKGKIHQAYLTLFTTQKVDGIEELAKRYFPLEVNVANQPLTVEECESKANTILTQNLHDLTKLFGTVRIRRHDVINKHWLVDVEADAE